MNDKINENDQFYIDGYLHKKERCWMKYWVILQGNFLLIHIEKPKSTEYMREYLLGWIEINKETKCTMGKKRNYSFPFYIQTKKGKYLFKTESALARHHWVTAVKLCAQGISPFIPRNFTEVDQNVIDSHQIKSIICDTNPAFSDSEDDVPDPNLVNREVDESDIVTKEKVCVKTESKPNLILIKSIKSDISDEACFYEAPYEKPCKDEKSKQNVLSPKFSHTVRQSPGCQMNSLDSFHHSTLIDSPHINLNSVSMNSMRFSRHLVSSCKWTQVSEI